MRSRHAGFVLLTLGMLALAACDGANDFSTGNQRSIDADITAAHDEGPTLTNQNPAQISVLPTVTVPFSSAY
ncbi:MAG: hypothetical protein ABSG66_11685 [Stellaceae bacterium]|jgi:hypothetical protein